MTQESDLWTPPTGVLDDSVDFPTPAASEGAATAAVGIEAKGVEVMPVAAADEHSHALEDRELHASIRVLPSAPSGLPSERDGKAAAAEGAASGPRPPGAAAAAAPVSAPAVGAGSAAPAAAASGGYPAAGGQAIRAPVTVIYADQMDAIMTLAASSSRSEIGGDLFGVWRNGEPLVVYALPPGPRARGHTTAFFQDEQWLAEKGKLLARKGLEHIGEWHSHHTLDLPYPSRGDCKTVFRALSRYRRSHFLLCIATLTRPSRSAVLVPRIRPFIFSAELNAAYEAHWGVKDKPTPIGPHLGELGLAPRRALAAAAGSSPAPSTTAGAGAAPAAGAAGAAASATMAGGYLGGAIPTGPAAASFAGASPSAAAGAGVTPGGASAAAAAVRAQWYAGPPGSDVFRKIHDSVKEFYTGTAIERSRSSGDVALTFLSRSRAKCCVSFPGRFPALPATVVVGSVQSLLSFPPQGHTSMFCAQLFKLVDTLEQQNALAVAVAVAAARPEGQPAPTSAAGQLVPQHAAQPALQGAAALSAQQQAAAAASGGGVTLPAHGAQPVAAGGAGGLLPAALYRTPSASAPPAAMMTLRGEGQPAVPPASAAGYAGGFLDDSGPPAYDNSGQGGGGGGGATSGAGPSPASAAAAGGEGVASGVEAGSGGLAGSQPVDVVEFLRMLPPPPSYSEATTAGSTRTTAGGAAPAAGPAAAAPVTGAGTVETKQAAAGGGRMFAVGDVIEARDRYGKWYRAKVIAVDSSGSRGYRVHFPGFSSWWDEFKSASEVAAIGTHTASTRHTLESKSSQWYMSAEGKEVLRVVAGDVKSVFGSCVVSRSKATELLEFQFKSPTRKLDCSVLFPANFPDSSAEVRIGGGEPQPLPFAPDAPAAAFVGQLGALIAAAEETVWERTQARAGAAAAAAAAAAASEGAPDPSRHWYGRDGAGVKLLAQLQRHAASVFGASAKLVTDAATGDMRCEFSYTTDRDETVACVLYFPFSFPHCEAILTGGSQMTVTVPFVRGAAAAAARGAGAGAASASASAAIGDLGADVLDFIRRCLSALHRTLDRRGQQQRQQQQQQQQQQPQFVRVQVRRWRPAPQSGPAAAAAAGAAAGPPSAGAASAAGVGAGAVPVASAHAGAGAGAHASIIPEGALG